VEVRIGVREVSRELTFQSAQTGEQVREAVRDGLNSQDGIITLQDEKGRQMLVPAGALAYVEIGVQEKGKVGFGSA
jgi:prefoldin subunit 5